MDGKIRVQNFTLISQKLRDRHPQIDSAHYADHSQYMSDQRNELSRFGHVCHVSTYFIGSPSFPSGYYKLRGKLNIPCSGYINQVKSIGSVSAEV